jgi:hypothetical protein
MGRPLLCLRGAGRHAGHSASHSRTDECVRGHTVPSASDETRGGYAMLIKRMQKAMACASSLQPNFRTANGAGFWMK